MRVRFLRGGIADLHWGGARRGAIKDIPDAQAEGLIASGFCERVEPEPAPPVAAELRTDPPTAATVSAPERAVQPKPRGRTT